MSRAFVGDVADVVRIESFRMSPLIVERCGPPSLSLGGTFSLRIRIIESSPGNLLPQTAHGQFSSPSPLEVRDKEAIDLGIRHEARQSSEAAF